jgi:hypothetical protein
METRLVVQILDKLTKSASAEIVKLLSDSQDPLVKMVAMRKFKYGYGMPAQFNRFAREFKILGQIYAEEIGDFEKFRVDYKQDKKIITRVQEAEINALINDAVRWTYSYWSSVAMARLLVRVGEEEAVLAEGRRLGLFPKTRFDGFYSDLIQALFE